MAMGTQLSIMNLSILLAEPNLPLLARVVSTLGYAQAEALAEEALQIEDRGGMLTKDHTRRCTPGGVFFHLVKQAVSPRQRYHIFQWARPPVKPPRRHGQEDTSAMRERGGRE
jgi:Phosphorylated adapter RNA export protein, RNA-binding domain